MIFWTRPKPHDAIWCLMHQRAVKNNFFSLSSIGFMGAVNGGDQAAPKSEVMAAPCGIRRYRSNKHKICECIKIRKALPANNYCNWPANMYVRLNPLLWLQIHILKLQRHNYYHYYHFFLLCLKRNLYFHYFSFDEVILNRVCSQKITKNKTKKQQLYDCMKISFWIFFQKINMCCNAR